jgi:hypothetical protein
MGWIQIDLEGGRTAYQPGDEVRGRVLWDLQADPDAAAGAPPEHAPDRAEVRLVWLTRGRGDRDSDVVVTQELPSPASADRRELRLRLPVSGPYSFSGTLISLVWAVEVVLEPGERAVRKEIVVSPTGREVLLHPELAGQEEKDEEEEDEDAAGDESPW